MAAARHRNPTCSSVGEQAVAPIDGGLERGLPGRHTPRLRLGQVELRLELIRQLAGTHASHPRGGELNRQRDALQSLADPGHRTRIAV